MKNAGKICVIMPKDVQLLKAQSLMREIEGASLFPVLGEHEGQVPDSGLLLVILGGEPDLPLIERMGRAARNRNIAIVYSMMDSECITEALWCALSADTLIRTLKAS